jgi:hypothetical protein
MYNLKSKKTKKHVKIKLKNLVILYAILQYA